MCTERRRKNEVGESLANCALLLVGIKELSFSRPSQARMRLQQGLTSSWRTDAGSSTKKWYGALLAASSNGILAETAASRPGTAIDALLCSSIENRTMPPSLLSTGVVTGPKVRPLQRKALPLALDNAAAIATTPGMGRPLSAVVSAR